MPACASCGAPNPDRARFCLECGAALAATQVGGETRKVVTILFCDVVGSTALGEHADAENVRAVMGRYFEVARGAIEAHGGTVEKFIGDAVMAVFGIPQLHEDDPIRAIRAALAIQVELDRLSRAAASPGTDVQARIGITTGEVVAGTSDSQTLVTGDAVNTAARIEQAASPGTVLIGALTERLVRGKVQTTALDPVEARGKAEPVTVYRVDGLVEHASPPVDAGRIVGRDAELGLVMSAVERAIDARGVELITVVAHPGVGKSTLIRAVEARLSAGTRVLRGRCLPYGDGMATWPIREAIRSAAGIDDDEASAVVVAKIAAIARPDAAAETIAAGVAQMMGVDGLGVGQDDAFWAVRRLFERLAEDAPLVAIFEDLHWADPVFLDVLEYVLDLSTGAPIAIITSARPDLFEARPSWAAERPNARSVRLGGLDGEAATVLCRSLDGGDAMPSDVVARIVEAAEGNPLFIEEMVASLRDEGVLIHDGSTWAMRGAEIGIPPSIKALLAARLDRLPEQTRAVIERGAVIGRIFETLALAQIAPEHLRASLTGHLLTLVRREFVRPTRSDIGGGDAYAFRHILIRDAAYDGLSKRDRADLHERIGGWIESVSADQLAQVEEVVAHHLEQAYRYRVSLGITDERTADLAERASMHLAAIGERNLVAGSIRAAAMAFRRALGLAGTDPPPMLLLNAGDTASRSGADDGMALLRASVEHAEARGMGEVAALATAVSAMHEVGLRLVPIPDAVARIERAVASLRDGDHAALARAKASLSFVLWGAGRLGDGDRLGEEVVAHWRAAGQLARVPRAVAIRCAMLVDGPTPVPDVISLCEGWLREFGDLPNARAVLIESLGVLDAMDGRYADARRHLSEAQAINGELGNEVVSLECVAELAAVEADAGDLDRAISLLNGLPERLAERNALQGPVASAELSRYRSLRGDPVAGLGTLPAAPSEDDDVFLRSVWHRSAALAHLGLGHLDDADRHARSALEVLEPTDLVMHRGDALEVLGDVARARGHADEARDHIRLAMQLYEAKQATAPLARALAKLDQLATIGPPA